MVDVKTILLDFCFCCWTRTGDKSVDPFRDNALLYFDLLWYSEDIIGVFTTLLLTIFTKTLYHRYLT